MRKNIQNDRPVIGPYGVNQEGSDDMYYKGASLLHTVRQVVNDDDTFRKILRGLNSNFYHQTVTTQQVETYISQESRKDLSKVFDQYLRTTNVPVLTLKVNGSQLKYKWDNCVDGFNMPVKLANNQWLTPTTQWQEVPWSNGANRPTVDPNFYINVNQTAD